MQYLAVQARFKTNGRQHSVVFRQARIMEHQSTYRPSYTQYTHAIADQVYLHQSILHDMLDVDRTFTTQHKTTHVCRSAVLSP